MVKIKQYRDLTLVKLSDDQWMVISCDSCGGIGEKPEDVVKTSPETVGYYTTQVALMEILAIGAQPFMIINALAVEMNNTGKRILEGIKRATNSAKLSEDIVITGSTEENIPVCQTAIGMTAIGMIEQRDWKMPKAKAGMLAVVAGIPKVGDEVVADSGKEILSIPLLIELRKVVGIQEILPIGSKGILYELKEMARTSNLHYVIEEGHPLDLMKSGGPSTCALLSIEEETFIRLRKDFPIPLIKIGRFIEK